SVEEVIEMKLAPAAIGRPQRELLVALLDHLELRIFFRQKCDEFAADLVVVSRANDDDQQRERDDDDDDPSPPGHVRSSLMSSDELHLPRREGDHFEQQPAVFPALDVGRAVDALAIADGQIDDLEAELRGAEEQVE